MMTAGPLPPRPRRALRILHCALPTVLAGWLLLAPPLHYGYIPDIETRTPTSGWYLIDRFDSAQSCAMARQFRIASAFNSLDRARKVLRRERRRRLLLWAYMWECQRSTGDDSSR